LTTVLSAAEACADHGKAPGLAREAEVRPGSDGWSEARTVG